MVTDTSPQNKHGLIARLIANCARHPVMTILFVIAAVVWGYYSMLNIPLDAIPDLSDPQVIIYTEWPGRSPDLVESQVTTPLSSMLLAAPNVESVRGQSFMGLSFIYVIFKEGTDIYWGRSRVVEYLSGVGDLLPAGVNPKLGPDATGVGWVFQYALRDPGGTHDLAELRSFQDWYLRYWLESIDGVAEVESIGGYIKQYQVIVDPIKLAAYNVPLADIITAIRKSNDDAGGQVIELAGHEFAVRGRGYIRAIADLEHIPIKVDAGRGVPIMLKDVATILIGAAATRGAADLNGEGDTVGGIVVMRYGQNALNIIKQVKARLEEIKPSLPAGVELVVTYDRSDLILRSLATLKETLFQEMLVVSLIVIFFLLHLRTALIPIVALPMAVVLAFIPMSYQNLTANIMSLGGIAVAIGAMVDASIVICENIHKRLHQWDGKSDPRSRTEVVIAAMQEVGPSIFYSLLVIMISFLPVFTLVGTEGRLFKPLAFTKTYAMGFAAILAITLIPALAVLLVRGRLHREEVNPLTRLLIFLYSPVVRFVVRHRWLVVILALLTMALSVPAFLRLQSEFMPPLNEGSILYMPTAPPGMSITEAQTILQTMNREIRQFPEVETVFGKIGRSSSATDPAPLSMVETVIILKPESAWREGMTWEKIVAEMDEKLHYPGMPNVWWMPIQTRTEMLSTGMRSPLGIKVYGADLATIENTAIAIEKALRDDDRTRPFTRSVFAERITSGYFLDIVIKREAAARYGLTVADIEEIINTAIGGMNITYTVEGRERYPINVRNFREFRDDLASLEQILIPTPTGTQVPLIQVADLSFQTGPSMIRSEEGQLVGFVFVDVIEKPLVDYVNLAQQVVGEKIIIPTGVRLEWAGQFKYFERAKAKLKVILPLTLFLIVVLLYLNTRSMVETGIVLLAVPFSMVGAVWLLYLLDYNLSVAVWVGFIVLAGVDAEMGVIMLMYLVMAHKQRRENNQLKTMMDLEDAIVEGAAQRIRPKLMTILTDVIGLLPVMWSVGAGADVMKRIAAPLVGGLFTSFLMELLVYPAIFAIWKKGRLK